MPVPTPRKGEKKNKFISRCIVELTDKDKSRKRDQIIAICYDAWNRKMEDLELQEEMSSLMEHLIG